MKKLIAALLLGLTLSLSAQTVVDGVTNNATTGIQTNVPVHVLPVPQQAQDQLSQYLVMIIPLVVPILIGQLKKFIPTVPSVYLPILAPILGALADLALQSAGVHTSGMVSGALLGSAGVGLRELANQIGKSMPKQPPAPVVPPPAPVAKQPGQP